MKKKFFFLAITILTACSVYKSRPKFDYYQSDNPWIDDFKDQVFFECLRQSYQSDTIFHLIGKKDAFNPYDGLSIEGWKKIKELAVNLVKNMPPPSLCDDCKNGQNYYMANALHYYQSRELDSVARAYYKKWLKEEKQFKKELEK